MNVTDSIPILSDFDEEKHHEEQQAINRMNQGLSEFVRQSFSRRWPFSRRRWPIPKGQVAIARDFAIVLNDNGRHLTLLGTNDDFKQLHTSNKIVKVAAAFSGYMGLTEHGNIVTCGPAHEFERSREIECWQNVKDITASEGHTVALFEDGSVESIDEPDGWEDRTPRHSMTVREWRNIVQVAVGYANVMGLTNDGRVIYHSVDGYTDCHFYDKFDDIVQIDCYSHYYGTDSSMVLHRNGTVSSDTFEGVDTWKGIVQISVGADIAIGLKQDGTIEMVDKRGTRYEAKSWNDLIYIECKFFGVVGINRRGQILSLYSD